MKKTEDQVFTEDERDSEQPMINKTAQMKTLNKGEVKMKTKCVSKETADWFQQRNYNNNNKSSCRHDQKKRMK